jgi:hypothetical protein
VLNLVGADLRVSIPAAGALVTAYAPGLGIGEPIDRADGWNLVAGVSLHRPRSVPPYVPDITARFGHAYIRKNPAPLAGTGHNGFGSVDALREDIEGRDTRTRLVGQPRRRPLSLPSNTQGTI